MKGYFQKFTSASPLVVFRIMLGSLLFLSVVRFWANGWIEDLYIVPRHFFPFYGFEFVRPFGHYTYLLFILCAVSALMVAAGMFYRIASTTLFLSFTYIELMDKSTYLNHYYFISMVCLLMIFLPAHVRFSFDAYRNKELAKDQIPVWCIDSIKLFVCLVYFYAGLAKINSDWLLHAQPLRIWLPAKNDLYIIGPLLNKVWVAYAFSWAGCLYDLSVPLLLLNKNTRPWAYCAVIIFHVFTAILFPIGMFPYIMMGTALIFFSPGFHDAILQRIDRLLKIRDGIVKTGKYAYSSLAKSFLTIVFIIFFAIQLTLPLRYMLYQDELFWTEEGYRFSWRVMLMEKAGYAEFTVRDKDGKHVTVNNSEFLTPLQEKMMAAQPDMILYYAHLLKDHYRQQGFQSPQVYVDSYVALNGRLGKAMIDPTIDLAQVEDSFHHKPWILPFENEIKGF
jgi:hypothetical protein